MNVQQPKSAIRRRAVNVSLREDIVARAKELGLNLSEVSEAALAAAVKAAAFEIWKLENAAALAAHRRRVERHGALLDSMRTF
jgi:antitoxin CcdA